MVEYGSGNKLGGSIQTAEIDDDAIGKAKLNADIVGIDTTTGKVNDINTTNFKSLSAANLTGLPDAQVTFTDVTTGNSSTTKHGYLVKLPNDAAKYIDGAGNWNSVSDADLATTDVTTNDSSTTKHGFLKKLDNVSTNFMNGQGAWAAPAGGGSGVWTEVADTVVSGGAVGNV